MFPGRNPFIVRVEGEASVLNCYIKCEIQKGQELCGNSEEVEFISTRGNPRKLPDEDGLDLSPLPNTSGIYTCGRREMCHRISA